MYRFLCVIFMGIMLSLLTGCTFWVYQMPTHQCASAEISAPENNIFFNTLIIYKNPYTFKSGETLGTLSQRINGTPVQIPANQLTTITVLHPFPNMLLPFTFTFIPQPGYSYIIIGKIRKIILPGGFHEEVTMQLLGADPHDQMNKNYHCIPFIQRNINESLLFPYEERIDKLIQCQLLAGQYYCLPKTTCITQVISNVITVTVPSY